ncbi:MAG: hypothetical protein KBT63_07945 [Porticoccaceae bacterium]|nr:hypothetical protein [Porticoccaceae bacterium]
MRIIPFRLTSKISEFDDALSEDIVSALQEQRKAILPSENVFGYSHGTRWRTSTAGNGDENEDGEMQVHSSEIEISFQEIVDNDLGAFAKYRNLVVSRLMEEFMRSMYQTVSDSTEKTGNVVNAKGGGFKAEQYVEMLERIEFGVDRNGNVSFPEIHAGPELVEKMRQELSAQGPDFEKKVQEIIQRKSEAALVKEDGRKSKFPKFGDE